MSELLQGRARGRGRRGRRPELNPEAPSNTPDPIREPTCTSTGRGRTRGAAAPPREPGAEVTPPSAPANHISIGRGMQRGSGRENPTSPPNLQMASLSLGQSQVGSQEHQRRFPWEKYVDHQWSQRTESKQGRHGTARMILTNYVAVSLPQTMEIHQYHVAFDPVVENIRIKHALVFSLSELIGPVRHFDGSILFITRQLPKDPVVCATQRTYDGATIEITFKYSCRVPHTSPQFLQISNGLLRHVQSALGMKLIKDHYFNMDLSVRIPEAKSEVIPGFSAAIGKFDGGTLMNLDMIHKILRIDTIYDVMRNLHDTLSERMRDNNDNQFRNQCLAKLTGSIVLTRYNNKTYRVAGIDWEKRVSHTFDKNGTTMSIEQYYKDYWNLTIQDRNQPLLISKPTERDHRGGRTQDLLLVPELCTMTGLGFDESDRRKDDILRQLAFHNRIGPEKRVETVERFLEQINRSEAAGKVLKPWAMTIGTKILEIPGREYGAEKLLVQDREPDRKVEITYDIASADWSRPLINCKFLNPVKINTWLLVFSYKCKQQAMCLEDKLLKVSKEFGMQVNSIWPVEIPVDRNEDYLRAIRSNLTQDTQMVIVVVPNDKKDRYDAIKKCCCIDNPVPSQVVQSKTMKKKYFYSVVTKIVMQINCKIGGEVWGMRFPTTRKFMIIGIDCYHDSVHKNQSVGAMVASLNANCTRYYSRTEVHDSKVEIMSSLSVLVKDALRKFVDVNKGLPEFIVIYRDGVGDGQLRAMFNSEKEQLLQAFGPNYRPGIAFVVVKKRIGTRLFLPSRQGIRNPQPGTVVDGVITKSEWYDFFLVSQSVRQGTVTPTSYNVIYDTIPNFTPDIMQRLTYKMTHLYFNWQGTIRVPAPCLYAHKLAYLQGQSLHREPSAYLADKLFYL